MVKFEVVWSWDGNVEEVEVFDTLGEAEARKEGWLAEGEEGDCKVVEVEFEWAWGDLNDGTVEWGWFRI